MIADLTDGTGMASGSFDCIILTQTLHLIFDVQAAIATLHRILAPGGVVLATVPGISQIDRGRWRDTWFWSFTVPSMTRLFGERFGYANVEVSYAGNALAAVAFLEGLATDELREENFWCSMTPTPSVSRSARSRRTDDIDHTARLLDYLADAFARSRGPSLPPDRPPRNGPLAARSPSDITSTSMSTSCEPVRR